MLFDKLNAVNIYLTLIWKDNSQDYRYIYHLFKFMSTLFTGNN